MLRTASEAADSAVNQQMKKLKRPRGFCMAWATNYKQKMCEDMHACSRPLVWPTHGAKAAAAADPLWTGFSGWTV
jgi:hypothetical protein